MLKIFKSLLQKFIDQYNNEIKKDLTQFQKIHAIAEFVHKCNILHPYHDANIRTFVFLIANRLLFENGFPLALFEEPNRFDGYSVNQLCLEIINGISHSIKISNTNYDLYKLSKAAEKTAAIEIIKFKRKSKLSYIDAHNKLPSLNEAKPMKFFQELSTEISKVSFNTKLSNKKISDLTKFDKNKNTQTSTHVSDDPDYGFEPGFLKGKSF